MPHTSVILDEVAVVGDAVEFLAHVRDFAGNLTDPSSAGFIVTDANKAVIANLTATKESVGQYKTLWQIPPIQAAGEYHIEFFGVFATDTHRLRRKFSIVYAT